MTDISKEVTAAGKLDNVLLLLKQLASIQKLHEQEYGEMILGKIADPPAPPPVVETRPIKKNPTNIETKTQKKRKRGRPPKAANTENIKTKPKTKVDAPVPLPKPVEPLPKPSKQQPIKRNEVFNSFEVSAPIPSQTKQPDLEFQPVTEDVIMKEPDKETHSPPRKRRKTRNSNRRGTGSKTQTNEDSTLFSSTDSVLFRCVKRRARPTGRAFEEEFLSCDEKNSTMINHIKSDTSLDRAQNLQELGMVQRLTMELDLYLRLASFSSPHHGPFLQRPELFDAPGACGERRPFLSIIGLKKLQQTRLVPYLIKGDVIHVPFTPEEQLLLIRAAGVRLEAFIARMKRPPSFITLVDFQIDIKQVCRYLPGRSEDDCQRFLQSFLSLKYYASEPEKLSDFDKKLYEEQNKLHVYMPREPPVILSNNHSVTKTAPIDKLLLLRDIHSVGPLSYKTKLFKSARQKGFGLHYTVAGATSEIIDVKIDPSGRKQIAICSSKTPKELILFDIAKKKERALEGHQKTVSRILYSRDGDLLLSASYDKTLRVWDTKSGAMLHNFEKRTVTETHPDGSTFEQHLPGHGGDIVSLARGNYDYDHIVVSADNSQGLFVWDIARGEMVADISRTAAQTASNTWPGPVLELEFIRGFHPEWFVTGTDNTKPTGPGVVQLWDVSDSKMVHCFTDFKRYVSCLQGSNDGNLVICGSADQNCYLYDLRSTELITTFQTSMEGDLDVNAVTFSPCERYMTCSGEDNKTLVFDKRTYKLLHILCHTRPAAYQAQQGVTSAKWIAGTNLLYTGGEDGVNLWDLESPKPLVNSYRSHTSPVSCLDRSEYYLVSGGDDSLVNIYSDRSCATLC